MSRENILNQVRKNQPSLSPLPEIEIAIPPQSTWLEVLKERLEFLHVSVFEVANETAIKEIVSQNIKAKDRVVTTIESLSDIASYISSTTEDAHLLENVELAIIPAHFAVAENGAMWITDSIIKYRVLPFITQQLAVVVNKEALVYNMHQAYTKIANTNYDFGVFIAGPSKTADIEQSLVLGAHGPKGMKVFILG